MNEIQPTAPARSPLELVRLKAASDEYKVHKSIYQDPVTGEPLEGFQTWREFCDAFLEDWKSNRRVVTEREADVHFDNLAEESLSELENIGAPTDVAALADQVAETVEAQDETTPVVAETTTVVTSDAATEVVAPKRRGRPPGSVKKVVVATIVDKSGNTVGTVTQKRRGRPAGVKKASASVAKAAAKKSGTSTSAKAQRIIEMYQAKDWSRKDIIEKLQSQIDGLGAAYASTLYQKFAK